MLIECLLKRDGGTTVLLDDIEYRFLPDKSGKHVCDIADDEHVKRLLAIPEAYEAVNSSRKKSSFPPLDDIS